MLSQNVKRYIPLAVWIVAVFTIIIVPLKIIGYGFLPMDDALRHAAKTISGKSWQQILVMRSDFPIDPSPGWQKILEWVHDFQNGNAESLVIFSVVALMLLVTLCACRGFGDLKRGSRRCSRRQFLFPPARRDLRADGLTF